MSNDAVPPQPNPLGWVRPAAWSLAVTLLALPAVAMQFTDEVNWSIGDFIAMGVMIGGAGLLLEIAVRLSGHWAYRAGALVAVLTSFFIIWVNLAVGIIGSEDNDLNLMFVGVLGTAMGGTIIAGFGARGMRNAMVATAGAQLVVAIVAAAYGYNIVPISIGLAGLWLMAAALFGRAARDQ